MELELANEVYVFYDKNLPGFKFYDRTPEPGSPVGKFAGVPPEGVFLAYELEDAKWDDEINRPNESVLVKYVEGTNTVTTIMVTTEKMNELAKMYEDFKQKKLKGVLRIDLRERESIISSKDIADLAKEEKIEISLVEKYRKFLEAKSKHEELKKDEQE